jgi:hypothetical protein
MQERAHAQGHAGNYLDNIREIIKFLELVINLACDRVEIHGSTAWNDSFVYFSCLRRVPRYGRLKPSMDDTGIRWPVLSCFLVQPFFVENRL